jgi:cytochrome b subunit of formate dehydrogenase
MRISATRVASLGLTAALMALLPLSASAAEQEYDAITNADCATCHEGAATGGSLIGTLHRSVHDGLECLDCHKDKGTTPHRPSTGFRAGSDGCRSCHDEEARQYQAHGRVIVGGKNTDIPDCADCHGSHGILPSTDKRSPVNPTHLPETCGKCHENLNITKKYEILIDHPVKIYEASVHGQATKGGIYVAATCTDCHSSDHTAHRILAPGFRDSAINHFNIPKTCGKCHKGIEQDYLEGIHGQMAANGETDAPVCTDCHGEHGILPPDDPRSPVSPARVAEMTCGRCHDSEVLNEKYGLPADRLISFVDSYHGLKSKAGDTRVANCASCHGAHRILPSSDPTSTINARNLRKTCGQCHPGISAAVASTPIHGVGGEGLHTKASEIVARVYQIAIVIIIGLMVIHWLIDLGRHIKNVLDRRPQIRRMRPGEVWQHMFLAVSFVVLVLSGFALRYDQSFIATLFFGWKGGFAFRGLVHRVAAGVFSATVVWHVAFLLTERGRQFLKDMVPKRIDFVFFWQQILHNLGRGERPQCAQRFSYVEKAEYWALVWGTVVMICTGLMLWFDNWLSAFLPKGILDVALTVHYWEAWLATLAILVWHLYSAVFSPEVYPMNPSWLTGTMPEEMYRAEHPGHLEEARAESEDYIQRESDRIHGDHDNPEGDRS